MVLFFDLDGPLLDVSPRYIRLHHDLVGRLGGTGMAPADYWARKRAVCTEESILAELGLHELGASYLLERLRLIETPEYLVFDRVWPWTVDVLQRLQSISTLVLVTARSQRDELLNQLDRLGLQRFFTAVLSEPAGRYVDEQKAGLIRQYLLETDAHVKDERHWMIGDTEADVGAGRRLGLTTVAVLSGIRDEVRLRQARPDHLILDIRELLPLLCPRNTDDHER